MNDFAKKTNGEYFANSFLYFEIDHTLKKKFQINLFFRKYTIKPAKRDGIHGNHIYKERNHQSDVLKKIILVQQNISFK